MPSRYHRYTLAVKLHILDAACTGGEWEAIAEANNISINTTRSWLRRYPTYFDYMHAPSLGGKRAQKMIAECLSSLLSKRRSGPYASPSYRRSGASKFDPCLRVNCENPLGCKSHHNEQFRKEPQYMNTERNKLKRRDFLVRLQQLQAAGKSVI
ncbi:hypothetical protein PF004_g4444 [Phytophthora fragariae]|uniref:Uncharacterized protein n=1 Tax=Phytophthora fragariae TaxID=53985 RepID=A0A6G0PIU3_9STRA|nr:hypothetical protein PF004_g4444 [Phytophthora fragariae]